MTLEDWADRIAKDALQGGEMLRLPLGSPLHDSIVRAICDGWSSRPTENQAIIGDSLREFNRVREAAIKRVTDSQC